MDKKMMGIIAIIVIIVIIVIAGVSLNGNKGTGNYLLEIETTGEWELDLTLNNHYTNQSGDGTKVIDIEEIKSVTAKLTPKGDETAKLSLTGPNGEVLAEESGTEADAPITIFYKTGE